MILLDTDICIELLRGNNKIIEKRKQYADKIAVSFMSIAELYYGIEKSGFKDHNKNMLEEFLLSIEIIHSGIDILEKFGNLKSELEN